MFSATVDTPKADPKDPPRFKGLVNNRAVGGNHLDSDFLVLLKVVWCE